MYKNLLSYSFRSLVFRTTYISKILMLIYDKKYIIVVGAPKSFRTTNACRKKGQYNSTVLQVNPIILEYFYVCVLSV